jgi:hypothetical protein
LEIYVPIGAAEAGRLSAEVDDLGRSLVSAALVLALTGGPGVLKSAGGAS